MKIEDFNDIVYEKDETGIVTVTLNTPKRKNALSPVSFLELFWAVDIMEKDDTAGIMIITGAKDPNNDDPTKEAFSSGGYFNPDAMKNASEEVKSQLDLTDIAQKKMTVKMFGCDKPIIAAINGLAIGGAFTMALSGADLIYMSEHAWIRMPFSNLGIIAELASSLLLPRLVGFQKAKEIVYFSKVVPAQEALELGIANQVLPHDELLPYAREQALKLIPPGGAGFAIRQMKRAFHKPYIEAVSQALDNENEGLNICFKTGDFMEAFAARLEKRDPVFKGK
ncbi:MAG: enoyl-CoA hydratase [Proteobacteria bacterium]|nr:enoyl-CoA hydratase [Pseudomonadota bacterium]